MKERKRKGKYNHLKGWPTESTLRMEGNIQVILNKTKELVHHENSVGFSSQIKC